MKTERWKHALTVTLLAAGTVALAATAVVGIQVALALRDARAVLVETQATITEARRRIKDTSQNTNALLVQLGLSADEWRRASVEQRGYWLRIAKDSAEATGRLNGTLEQAQASLRAIQGVAESVERDTLPAAAQALTQASASVKQVSDESVPLLRESARAAGNAADLAANPDIAGTLHHLDETSANLASMTAHIDKTAAHIDELTSPKKKGFWLGVLKFLIPKPVLQF